MCYDANTSLTSFLINYLSTFIVFLFALNYDVTIAAQFFSYVGLMQLFDYIFWMNPGPSNINYNITKIAMIVNHLQPIILVLLIYNYKKTVSINTLIALTLYIIIASIYSQNAWNKITYTREKENGKGLNWEWNTLPGQTIMYTLFLLTLLISIYENFNGFTKYLLLFLFTISYIISYLKNYIDNNKSTGRLWCYYSSFIPIIILISSLLQN